MADEMNKLNVQAGFTITDEESGLAEISKIINSINQSSKTLGKSLKTVEDALTMLTENYKTGNKTIVTESKKTKGQLQEDARQTTRELESNLKKQEESHKASQKMITDAFASELRKREVTHRQSEQRQTAEFKSQLKLREKAYKDASKQSANSLKELEKAFNPDSIKNANNYLNYFKRNIAQTALTVTGVRTVLNEFSQVSAKVVEIEKNAINIKRIMQTSSEETSKALIDSAFEAAKATATQVTDAQKIQASWVRINDLYARNTDLLGEMTTLTSKFMNVGEIEDADEAVTLLNATMLQFGLTTENSAKTIANAEEVLNKWAYMADKTALGTADEYGEGMSRFGGQLRNLNGDVDDAIVLMSILSDKLAKTGEEAGTSLKTFTAYLTRTKTTNLFDQIANDLGDTSYRLIDANGKFKEFRELMNTVSSAYEHYKSVGNDVMAQSILDAVGATRQRDVATALLESWNAATNGAQKYYDLVESASVTGYMDEQNAALLESFAAQWEQLKTSMAEAAYAIADAGLLDALSGLMNGLQSVMEIIADANPAILSAGVGIAELVVAFKAMQKVLSFSKTYKEYINLLKYGTKAQRDYALTLGNQIHYHLDLANTQKRLGANHAAAHYQLDILNKEYKEGILTVDEYKDGLMELNKEHTLGIVIDAEGNIVAADGHKITVAKTAATKQETLATIAHKVATGQLTVAEAAQLAIEQEKTKITNFLTSSIGKLTIAIGVAVGAYKLWTWWQDRHNRAFEESFDKYQKADEELVTYTQELNSAKEKLEELQKLSESGEISAVDQAELDMLNEELPLMEQKLRILKEQARIEKEQAAADFVNSVNTKDNNHEMKDEHGNSYMVKMNDIELLQQYNSEIQSLAAEYSRLSEAAKNTDLDLVQQKALNEQAEQVKSRMNEIKKSASELSISLIGYAQQFAGMTDSQVAGIEGVLAAIKAAVFGTDEAMAQSADAVGDVETAVEDAETALEDLQFTFSQLSFNNAAEGINNITSSIQGLTEAQEKLAKGTALSNLELMELAQKYPELLTQANLFADGTVEGQRNAINAVLGMKQEEFNSSIDQKIAELDAENELINAQLVIEAEKNNMIAKMQSMLNNGMAEDEVEKTNEFARLQDLQNTNFVTMADNELVVNEEAKNKLLEQDADWESAVADSSQLVGEHIEEGLTEGSSSGTTAVNTNFGRTAENANLLMRLFDILGLSIKENSSGNGPTGSSGSYQGKNGVSDGGGVSVNGSGKAGTVGSKSISSQLSAMKQATSEFISKLKEQYSANVTIKTNLEKYKDTGITSVSNKGSGGSGGAGGGSGSGKSSGGSSGSSGSSKSGTKDRYGNDTDSSAYKDAVNAIEDLQDKIVAALKKKYQELYDARVAYLEKERDVQIKVHNDRIAQLQEEIEKIQGNTTEDKEKTLAQLQQQYELWKEDNSTLGKSKQKDLSEQIKELSDEIKIDKLEQEIEEEQAAIDAIEEYFESLFDADSPLYDPELKVLSKKMTDQNLYTEANELIRKKQTDEIIDLLTKYGEIDYSGMASLMGEEAGDIIAKEVNNALSSYSSMIAGALKDINTSSSGGGSYSGGSSSSGGSSGGGSSSSSGGSSGGSSGSTSKCGSVGHTVAGICPNCGNRVRKRYRYVLYNTATGKEERGSYSYSSSDEATSAGREVVFANKKANGSYLYRFEGTEWTLQKYAKGGIVSKNNNLLDMIAKSIGEDTMIAAKAGERVLSPAQTKAFDDLVYDFLPKVSTGFNNNGTTNNTNVTFNKELVSVRVDKVINNTPYDVKDGQDNLDRMFRTSLKKAGMNINV